MKTTASLVLVLFLVMPVVAAAQAAADSPETDTNNQCIVWSSGDREVALKLVYMYVYNAKKRGWMDRVMLLVWGPSAKLLSVDEELQGKLDELKEVGVELVACKACADLYGVSDKLEELGIEVKYAGKMLADMQKDGWHVLAF
jgi:hypothetical protein